jgi:hypothetical protein
MRMRSRQEKLLILIVIGAWLSVSCAATPKPGTALTAEQREDAKKQCIAKYTAAGAVGGALGGAVLGVLTGGKAQSRAAAGAVIGALAGGAMAFAVAYGHCMALYSDLQSFPEAGAGETAQKIGYTPEQGYITRIERFALDPTGVAPGGRVDLNGSYFVMGPEADKDVKVVETRTVHFFDPGANGWKELGSVDQPVTAALGTRRAEGSIELPADVPEGRYRIVMKVAANGKQDEASQELVVRRGLALGPAPRPIQAVAAAEAVAAESPAGGKTVAAPKPPRPSVESARVKNPAVSVREAATTKGRILAEVKQEEVYPVVQKVLNEEGIWYKLRLEDGAEGWVPHAAVKLED